MQVTTRCLPPLPPSTPPPNGAVHSLHPCLPCRWELKHPHHLLLPEPLGFFYNYACRNKHFFPMSFIPAPNLSICGSSPHIHYCCVCHQNAAAMHLILKDRKGVSCYPCLSSGAIEPDSVLSHAGIRHPVGGHRLCGHHFLLQEQHHQLW